MAATTPARAPGATADSPEGPPRRSREPLRTPSPARPRPVQREAFRDLPSPPAFHPVSDTVPGPLDACLLPGPKANGACQAATLHFQGSTTPWLFLVA
ncbi:unnamed protein product [Rangifer tarandus platyrhynchus]|uniref:Uncharacterized protein n=1 Tax=Rangifer tarandus platyrhynchus TaxID=3082113 RepID=A0AC59YMF6_RANTA